MERQSHAWRFGLPISEHPLMNTWHLRDRVLTFERCLVMGIVNVTPDSFSDGGRYSETQAAVDHALGLIDDGADILDIGGESTRPGSQPVPEAEELRRVVPVVQALVTRVRVPISVDTSKAAVARACLEAGAHIINDVTGLCGDPDMPGVVRAFGAGAIVMHMQGTPATMQVDPRYDNVVIDIYRYFAERLQSLADQGLPAEKLVLDPGIGFGKKLAHNLELLARLDEFQRLGRPLCLGVSRKGLIRGLLQRPVEKRLAGSLAVACDALAHGAAQLLRVHDIAETRDAAEVFAALAAVRASRND
jgi:dihydropteroate synthase